MSKMLIKLYLRANEGQENGLKRVGGVGVRLFKADSVASPTSHSIYHCAPGKVNDLQMGSKKRANNCRRF